MRLQPTRIIARAGETLKGVNMQEAQEVECSQLRMLLLCCEAMT
jgi:hypothetical protein